MNPSLQQEQFQEKILQNVETIIGFQAQRRQNLPKHQLLLESIATAFGQPWFLYAELIFFSTWGIVSHLFQSNSVDWGVPQFNLREQGIGVISLVISTGVLIYQTREEEASEERAHLALQLNLITEQKIAKLIALVEELRADSPDIRDRLDPEAAAMQQTTDPQVVIDILQATFNPASTESEIETIS